MEINTALTEKRGVSLPFTDYCDPLFADGVVFKELLGDMIEYGEKSKWKSLEFRTENPLSSIPVSFQFYGHSLDISRNEETIVSGFRDSTRRNIKKAEKEGVAVTIDRTFDSVREFYRLNCLTRKDHGLPCQPYIFFEKMYSHIIAKNLGVVILATINEINIAGAVFFNFGNRVIYKYGASDRNYLHLRANNLIMWKAIQWYCGQGYQRFNFGRTERENTGLLQFKRGWGAREYSINYYKYDFRQRAFVSDHVKVTGLHNRIFRMMPIPLLKIAGAILYRHAG
ncbi:peptidoglycan bridge formation glycyltransferase FemA/FemB family protein [Geobacter luticola]|uniref:Peptidoglycan bridge formation glycyltransferase FemA/FemB family protein n=2 Tax=Geomobilimonas luticola TaxID=1114878 RepID=A0ABS5SE85_9BACT|nr:peptidoglycan bridge formation glycyltransferase FemA/FemB family protein [Geomobilimonas luticola]